MTPEQQARLERLVGPAALAYYETLDELDTDGLLTDYGGEVRLVAASVLRYAAASKREAERVAAVAAGDPVKAFTAVTGMKVEFGTNARAQASQADAWDAEAARLELEVRRSGRRSGSTSVRVEVGW